ncbi:hypothetical protein L7F22_016326 [Adiantum nelumboides]|nr:hypothetical protein [Adiantum nelumboides]
MEKVEVDELAKDSKDEVGEATGVADGDDTSDGSGLYVGGEKVKCPLERHIASRKDLFCSLDAAPAGKKVTCANNASYPIKGIGTLENGLFVLDRYEKQIQACITETKTQAMQDAELRHARFGHVGYGSLMTLQRHNMVHDLSLLEMPPRHVCEGCVLGKMHIFAFSQDGSVRATRKLQLVHSDVCGPMRMPSVGNSLYFVTFIDDFSRFCWVYPVKANPDVFAIFQHYVSMVENETGCKVQTLRTDRGGVSPALINSGPQLLKRKPLPQPRPTAPHPSLPCGQPWQPHHRPLPE